MKLSHTKLNTILSCPMTYYLNYKEGITPKEEKKAFSIGSAFHWGVEHSTENLEEYYKDEKGIDAGDYGEDELLAESMVHGYLKHKDEIFDDILDDGNGGRYELVDETHELEIWSKLKSYSHPETPHDFQGIIDLLLSVKNKDGEVGFILIDYKTSSRTPDWDDYLDQIYRYIFLLESEFPGVPVLKIGIINARKASIKIKKNENNESFLHRLKLEYDINDNNYICYHIFDPAELDRTLLDNYIDNLSRMADMADNIDTNKLFFINYKNAKNQYGKSPYYDIFYGVPDCYMLYKIKDTIWDEDDNIITKERDCLPLDMQVINHTNVLNHYSKFKNAIDGSLNKSEMNKKLKSMFITDESLLEKYWRTYDNENKLK